MHELLPFIQEHWLLVGLLVAILVAITITEMMHNQFKLSYVTPQQLVEMINRDRCVVVDVRSKNAYADGHIIKSINLPAASVKQQIDKIQDYTDQTLVVVAEQEPEAMKSAKVISYEGFEHVKVLKGGLRAWREEKLPMEKK